MYENQNKEALSHCPTQGEFRAKHSSTWLLPTQWELGRGAKHLQVEGWMGE